MMHLESILPMAVVAVFGAPATMLVLSARRAKQRLKATREALLAALDNKQFVDGPSKDAIATVLQSDPVFAHAWNEFEETLVYEKKPDGSVSIYNTRPFHEFLSRDRFMESELHANSLRHVPGIITSVGLLFSFILIQNGLQGIDINSPDPNKGINHFIDQLKGKFWSSILGILGAVVFQILSELLFRVLEEDFTKIIDYIEKKFRRKKPEDFLLNMDRNISDLADNMKIFTTSLATTIGAGIKDGMSVTTDRMLTAIDGLKSVISKLEQQSQQNGTELLQKLIQEMNDTYKGAANKELEGLAGTIRTLSGALQASSGQSTALVERIDGMLAKMETTSQRQQAVSQQSLDAIQGTVVDLIGKLKDTSESQAAATKDSVAEVVNRTKGFTEEFAGQFVELLKRNKEILGAFDSARQGLIETVGTFQQAVRSTEDILTKSHSTAAEVATAATTAMRCQTALTEDMQRLSIQSQKIQETQHANLEVLNKYQGLFAETEQTLGKLITDISNHLSAYNNLTKEHLENHLETFAKHMGDAATKLSSTVTGLDEHLDQLTDFFEGRRKAVRE